MSPAPRQHTPGPWSLSASFDRVERRVQHGDNPPLVWGIASGINSAHPDYMPRAEQIANARIIASAPELLAALERSEEGLRCLLDEVALLRAGANPEPQSDYIRTCALIQARAAIAKATATQ